MRIVEAIVRDQRTVLSVSSVLGGEAYGLGDVSVSLPSVIGAGGVQGILRLPLSAAESEALHASAAVVRAAQDLVHRPT